MIDYSKFYSRSFKNIDRFTKRLHFFTESFTEEEFKHGLEGDIEFLNKLKKSYLGFVVIKPIKNSNGAPLVGRTILQTYSSVVDDERRFFLTGKSSVSLFGIPFDLKSLPFQAQDKAVSACATIALWISLHTLNEFFGISTSSPFEVTERSVSFPAEHRNFPSSGLNILQIKNYFNILGLETEIINIEELTKLYWFRWDDIPGNDNLKLIEFLKQYFGIDWVKTATIEKIDGGKTIKVSTQNNYLSLKLNDEQTEVNLEIDGVRTEQFIVKIENSKINIYTKSNANLANDVIVDAVKAFINIGIGLPIIATLKMKKNNGFEAFHAVVISGYRHKNYNIKELYIHDDQIGPYSKVEFDGDAIRWKNEWVKDYGFEEVLVQKLIVPVYPKIRLSFGPIYDFLLKHREMINLENEKLHADLYLMQVKEYKKFLLECSIEDKEKILIEPLPRFLWIIRTHLFGIPILDFVYDGTLVFPTKIKNIHFKPLT